MNNYEFCGDHKQGIFFKAGHGGEGFYFANGFQRIVHGGRGDYVEFSADQLDHKQRLKIPPLQAWRVDSNKSYYIEYRDFGVKIYYQKRTVPYADYKVGYYYVSPIDLFDFKVTGRR